MDVHEGLPDQLRARGFDPKEVRTVVMTHLHVDHVGWNTRLENGRWVPTFPRARYLFARREWEHWTAESEEGTQRIMGDSVAPVLDAGLAELVDMDHRVTDEIRLEPTPGHTPGHVSVRLASGGADAVITGDLDGVRAARAVLGPVDPVALASSRARLATLAPSAIRLPGHPSV